MPRKKKNKEDKKYNLTININENLLKEIDFILNKSNDKRSRLIERLLIDYIEKNNKL